MTEPVYSVIMAVHNALDMVRVSTLRTLRHIAGQPARLIVVDNASTDGASEWLAMLEKRGDIDLLRSDTNLRHGPALELARRGIKSRYIVTLDSDAFPLTDRWLNELAARITGDVKLSGILHHRDYIHPSCLMIETRTLDDWGVTFLNEKSQPSGFDVAERISHEARRRGYGIAGLTRSGSRRRGSVSEPVYLGSVYEDTVYHQWYATRAFRASQVDDVPRDAIDRSLEEAVREFDAEPRGVTIVVGVRASADQPERVRNAKACLWALNLQTTERWRYRILVVEQDSQPRLQRELAPLADRYIFARNPGPYNRGWAFNIGARLTGEGPDPLCLIDADLVAPPDFIHRGLEALADGRNAFQPFREVVFLDRESSERLIHQRLNDPWAPLHVYDFDGAAFGTAQGGCIWVRSNLYHLIGGHDERFRGWGREDREFHERLARTAKIKRLAGCILHLHHPRPDEDDECALANRRLHESIQAGAAGARPNAIGSLHLYAGEDESGQSPSIPTSAKPASEFERIVNAERFGAERRSTRWHLAEVIHRFGGTVLDIGCGSGALWTHLRCAAIGVDSDVYAIAAARRLYPSVPVLQGDASLLPLAGADVVVFRHMLEHLGREQTAKALKEAFGIARAAVIFDFGRNGATRDELVGERLLCGQDLRGWHMYERFLVSGREGERDEIWVFVPPAHTGLLSGPHENGGLKVSIVMPTYRRSHTILRTVDTIRAQTYRNWELIVVDNAGDGGYAFGDPRIRVIAHKVGPSSSHARNQGVRNATGDLVCFFDDDDDMFCDYLESVVYAFERNQAVKMVRCGMLVSSGEINHSYATPECILRRELATPSWEDRGGAQDQRYFSRIVVEHDLSLENGSVAMIERALCRARSDPHGGLRNGNF